MPPKRPLIAAVLATAAGFAAVSGSAMAVPTPALDPLAQPQAFRSPGNEVRPQFRWWWGGLAGSGGAMSPEETKREVAAMADAGFGSFEIAFSSGKWATAEQRENLEAALQEARDRGMTADMTIGASWPVRTLNTAPGPALAPAGAAVRPRRRRSGPAVQRRRPAPLRRCDQRPQRQTVRRHAAKVVTAGPAVTTDGEAPSSSTVLDPSSLIDLTADVVGGNLTWERRRQSGGEMDPSRSGTATPSRA